MDDLALNVINVVGILISKGIKFPYLDENVVGKGFTPQLLYGLIFISHQHGLVLSPELEAFSASIDASLGIYQNANEVMSNSSRQGFSRPSNRGNNQQKAAALQNTAAQGSGAASSAQSAPETSSSMASTLSVDANNAANESGQGNQVTQLVQSPVNRRPLYFFREENSTFIVKGNFMTLAALPKHLDLAEWLAHQIVEQTRLLDIMISMVMEVDHNVGLALCSPTTCPTMKVAEITFSWLDATGKPTKVPAAQYMALVKKWIMSKVHNPAIFPTDMSMLATNSAGTEYASGSLSSPMSSAPIPAGPTTLTAPMSTLAGNDWLGKSAGFPETFPRICCDMMRQMFRCYAHLYWAHWVEPFYHVNRTQQLNSCFVHFMTVAKLFGMLTDKDTEPMQPLIDIWIRNKAIPAEAVPALTRERADAAMASSDASPLATANNQA